MHSMPNAEDFSLTATPKNIGIYHSIENLLINYDGRYFTNLLHAINPMALGFLKAYNLTIVFGIFLSVLSVFYFLSSLNLSFKRLKVFQFSMLFILIGFATTPSLPHLLTWMVSSFVYLYSFCFWLLWMGTYFRYLNKDLSKFKTFYLILASLLLVLSIGMNEMFLVINTFSLLVFMLYFIIQNHKLPFSLFILAAIALLSLIFFISNPGILQRVEYYKVDHSDKHYFEIFPRMFEHVLFEFKRWFLNSYLVLLFLIYVALNFKQNNIINTKTSILLFISFTFINVLSLFAFYIPMGHEDLIPYRIYTSFFLILQLVLMLFFIFYDFKIFKNKLLKPSFSFIILCLMAFSLCYSHNNLKLILKDFQSGIMTSYKNTMEIRYEITQAAASNNVCWKVAILPKINDYPVSIFYNPDLPSNRQEEFWNLAYENYFMIQEIRLEGDTIFKKHIHE